jgi:hypothetical protein
LVTFATHTPATKGFSAASSFFKATKSTSLTPVPIDETPSNDSPPCCNDLMYRDRSDPDMKSVDDDDEMWIASRDDDLRLESRRTKREEDSGDGSGRGETFEREERDR